MPYLREDLLHRGVNNIYHDGSGSKVPYEISVMKAKATLIRDNLLATPSAPCRVHDYINHQMLLHPDAPAIQYESENFLSYGELDKLAERIALVLPITPNTVVPICMDVSVGLVATIVAILRSGAAYCILDPGGSVERNKGIVEDTNADMVIVDRAYAPLFDKSLDLEDALSKKSIHASEQWDTMETAPSDAAYLIYTSGESLLLCRHKPGISLSSILQAPPAHPRVLCSVIVP